MTLPTDQDGTVPVDNEGSFLTGSHDVTLQRLDLKLPYKGTKSGYLEYNVDNFTGTESAWDSALAVFVPPGVPIQHVDHAAFAHDPQGEARRLGYRIAGHHTGTTVVTNGPGEPRTQAKVVFTDLEADRYATEGKLSISTGFDAKILPEGVMDGKVTPNHVLYFLRNEPTAFGTPAVPNDTGAMVNNLSMGDTMPDDETKTLLQKIADAVCPKPELTLKTELDNIKSSVAEKDAKISALEAENKTLKESKDALDNLRTEQEKTAKEARWQQVKNLMKPGLFHKPEDETKLRADFEKDNAGFMIANVGNLKTAGDATTTAQGSSSVGNVGNDGPVDVRAAVGHWNPVTGKMEV